MSQVITKKPAIKVAPINIVEIAKRFKLDVVVDPLTRNDKACIWVLTELEPEHAGDVYELLFFNGVIEVFVCERHLEWHMAILALFYHAHMDIEDIFNLSKDDCLTMANKLCIPIVEM
jgi:hypothetical protein